MSVLTRDELLRSLGELAKQILTVCDESGAEEAAITMLTRFNADDVGELNTLFAADLQLWHKVRDVIAAEQLDEEALRGLCRELMELGNVQ